MRGRLLLFVLLAGNVLLAVGWWRSERREAVLYTKTLSSLALPAEVKTNVLIRRQFFNWQQVESSEYPKYVENLRLIGCPEQTIRDIIIADVNGVFARRRAMEVVMPSQQWWRPEPDTNLTAGAEARIRELEDERRGLLTSLLGGNWEAGDQINLPRPSRPGLDLDGTVLGSMANDAKQSVQEINARAQERNDAYIAAQKAAGKPVDEAELAKLRQQTRAELAQVLTPLQLEEFLLRYSQAANNLRAELGQLKYFNATPDEFRSMFRALDPINQQLELLADKDDAASVAQRKALQEQGSALLKSTLGATRYEQYVQLHDEGFRNALAIAQSGGAPQAAGTIQEINQATTDELARIRSNTNLSPQQLALELKKAEMEQLKAQMQALGQQVPQEPAPAAKAPPVKTHVLNNGETLSFLTRLYGIDEGILRAANPNVDFNKLKPGEQITVPMKLPPGVMPQ